MEDKKVMKEQKQLSDSIDRLNETSDKMVSTINTCLGLMAVTEFIMSVITLVSLLTVIFS